MSDDEADPELLALLRQSLGLGPRSSTAPPETRVLDHARFIYDNSIDVALDMRSTHAAADLIWNQMQAKEYSTANWSQHELHPKSKDDDTVNFIFAMDLINFSFWSDKEPDERFSVEWKGKQWTGYWSMVAALQRAISEEIPITDPAFWIAPVAQNEVEMASETNSETGRTDSLDEDAESDTRLEATQDEPASEQTAEAINDSLSDGERTLVDDTSTVDRNADTRSRDESTAWGTEANESELSEFRLDLGTMRDIFRSSTREEMPLLQERLDCFREAGKVLDREFGGSVINLINRANNSAAALVNLLVDHFPCFRDESRFEGRRVRFFKRAQIFVADLWAAFDGQGYGAFDDIDSITIFADYRIPQILQKLGCLWYSPPLESHISHRRAIPLGHSWEVQIRGCSIWSVELIRRQILAKHHDAKVNAILIDFFLYDTVKEFEKDHDDMMPHHRTRSIWY